MYIASAMDTPGLMDSFWTINWQGARAVLQKREHHWSERDLAVVVDAWCFYFRNCPQHEFVQWLVQTAPWRLFCTPRFQMHAAPVLAAWYVGYAERRAQFMSEIAPELVGRALRV